VRPVLGGVPAPSLFVVSAVFHYLGPSFAVLLFARMDPLGVAWLRLATAAAVFAGWRRPWRVVPGLDGGARLLLVAWGVVLAAMNMTFYLAIARLPLSTVGSIEFLGVIVLAVVGLRGLRNATALVLAILGVAALTDVRLVHEPWGFWWAFANCALFMLYVVLGHRVARHGIRDGSRWAGVDQLGAAMVIATLVATPVALHTAAPAFTHVGWLLAGAAVGICSSVIPYVTDQLVMARLHRTTFALMLTLLPASATVIGLLVLGQVPTIQDLAGVTLVIAAVALHRQPVTDDR
jgi:inner membrane transporter RhtA